MRCNMKAQDPRCTSHYIDLASARDSIPEPTRNEHSDIESIHQSIYPEASAFEDTNHARGSTGLFALTEDELRPLIKKSAPSAEFDIIFLSKDQGVALLPTMSSDNPDQLTTLLTSLQPAIASGVVNHDMAASVVLCQFDTSDLEPRIIEQQGRPAPAMTGGWSQVAARRAMPMTAPVIKPVGQRSAFIG